MTQDMLINLAAMAAAGVILWRTEPALARMGCRTPWMVRYAMLLIAGGALAVIACVLTGIAIDFATLLVLAGLALLLLCERRIHLLARAKMRGRHA